MIHIGCIADDFTGAGDAASFLRKSGLKTVYISGGHLGEVELPEDAGAVVIALKCRSIPREEAVSQASAACRWLTERGARHIYYKYCSTFDSTERGNIGPVTDALMELMDARYTILCPALPINGRTVENGVLFVNGVPLAESPMKDHPITPMRASYLPDLMTAQSAYPCISITRRELYEDKTALINSLDKLSGEKPFSAAVDYLEDKDGARIAELFSHLPLLTGGSGLLEHLGRRYAVQAGAEAQAVPEYAPSGAGRLILVGSCSDMTRRQLAKYRASGKKACKVDPLKLLSGEQTLSQLKEQILQADGDILFYSTDDVPQIRENQKLGAERVSEILESTMGALAVAAVDHGCTRVVVAGGETSGRVALSLGYEVYEVFESVAPGVPRMTPVSAPGLSIVLKSGNFGDEDFLLTALS